MDIAEALDTLEKITATEEERKYWEPILAAGAKAEEEIDRLENAEAQAVAAKAATEEKVKALKEALPEKYLQFGLNNKARRHLFEHKQKIVEAEDLLADYAGALQALKQPMAAARHKMGQGMRIRDKVVLRIQEAKDTAGK